MTGRGESPPADALPVPAIARRTLLVLGASAVASACSDPPNPYACDARDDATGGRMDVTRRDASRPDANAPFDGGAGMDAGRPDAAGCVGADVGAVDDFPPDSLTLVEVSRARVFIGRDAGGIYAMGSGCSHFIWPLEAPVCGTIRCPNPGAGHGSYFDTHGNRLTGPATMPLFRHPIIECAGRLFVDTTRLVSLDDRLVIPEE